tara:strand:+ start:1289 stop:2191 length:903 start_codon:yes stop_codon:yes gene_type:complete
MRLFKKNPKISFLSYYKYAFGLSVIFIVSGIISIFVKGLETSIDFTGGTIVNVETNQENIDLPQLRIDAENIFNKTVNIVLSESNGSAKNLIFTMDFLEDEKILDTYLQNSFKENYQIVQVESIGPKLGDELKVNARNAILASLLLIGLYITIRFDRFYALGSLAALLHDVLIILSIFSIFNLEVSVAIIAAFLTIVGYSLNDTIVIYDRIRENMFKFSERKKDAVINLSLNETLSRTIITSVTTLLVVVSLYLFGGEILQPFALALIIGVIIGSYSSIFIASPIMFIFEEKFNITSEQE